MVHLMIFLAEIQTRIVLKFGNIPFSTFRDMVVQSRSSQTKTGVGRCEEDDDAVLKRKMFTLYDNVFI